MDATTFHNIITEQLHTEQLSESERNQAVLQIKEIVLQGVLSQSVQLLDQGQRISLSIMVQEKKSPQEIFDFFLTQLPQFQQSIRDEIDRVIKTIQ
jgi:hypothetical protein